MVAAGGADGFRGRRNAITLVAAFRRAERFHRLVGSASGLELEDRARGSSLHLTLLAKGCDLWTVAILVAATTVLGIYAALDRHRSGSLGPPLATHVAFNVGGVLGGVLVALAALLATGQPPAH